MKQFILKIILFTLFIVAIDRLFVLLKYSEVNIYNDISKKKLETLATYLQSRKADTVDIAIFGSSHPQFGISPDIISSITGKTCINYAYAGGTNLGAQYEFIKKVNVKARVMVYAIDVFSLNQVARNTDEFQKVFFKEAGLFTLNEDYLSYSNMYLYAHFAKRYLQDVANKQYTLPYLRKTNKADLSMFRQYNGYGVTRNGWVKGDAYPDTTFSRYAYLPFEPLKPSVAALGHIAKWCRDNKVKLIIIQVPEHAKALSYAQKYTDFDKWMNRFASTNNVTYLNFDTEDKFPVHNDSLFFDTDHLNVHGAEVFSAQLAKSLMAAGL